RTTGGKPVLEGVQVKAHGPPKVALHLGQLRRGVLKMFGDNVIHLHGFEVDRVPAQVATLAMRDVDRVPLRCRELISGHRSPCSGRQPNRSLTGQRGAVVPTPPRPRTPRALRAARSPASPGAA